MRLAATRDHFECPSCGAHAFPTRSIDGVGVLGELTSHPCPLCHQPLVSGALEDHQVEHCGRCEGFLIAQRDFGFALQIRRAWQDMRRDQPPRKPIDPSTLAREVDCPRCGKVMYTEPHLGPGGAVLDTCVHCERVWPDGGEFSALGARVGLTASGPGSRCRRASPRPALCRQLGEPRGPDPRAEERKATRANGSPLAETRSPACVSWFR